MKICVLVKQVPDKDSQIEIAQDQLNLVNENITWVTNESDNYAIEEALLLKEKHGAEVIVCTLGNETSRQVLKDALAKGADKGIFISNDSIEKSDILTIAKTIATALKKENFDLVLSGLQSDDQGNSQLGLLLAELLDMSHGSLFMETDLINSSTIKVKKELEGGWFQWTNLSLPASISIQSGINTPRYATLKGIMMVKKKTVEDVNIEDLSVNTTSKTAISKMYKPNKSKETQFIEGSTDDITNKLIDIFRNEIKVIN